MRRLLIVAALLGVLGCSAAPAAPTAADQREFIDAIAVLFPGNVQDEQVVVNLGGSACANMDRGASVDYLVEEGSAAAVSSGVPREFVIAVIVNSALLCPRHSDSIDEWLQRQ